MAVVCGVRMRSRKTGSHERWRGICGGQQLLSKWCALDCLVASCSCPRCDRSMFVACLWRPDLAAKRSVGSCAIGCAFVVRSSTPSLRLFEQPHRPPSLFTHFCDCGLDAACLGLQSSGVILGPNSECYPNQVSKDLTCEYLWGFVHFGSRLFMGKVDAVVF